MKSVKLQKRNSSSKGDVRVLRREGKIPCSVYGLDKPPVACAVAARDFEQIAGADLYNVAFNVDIDGSVELVLCRAVQFCPVTERVIHVDFLRVERNVAVVARVPIVFNGIDVCPGIKKKGTLNRMLRFVRVMAKSFEMLPERAVVDLSNVDAGVTLGLDAVSVPEGVTIKDVGKTVAKIIPPRVKSA